MQETSDCSELFSTLSQESPAVVGQTLTWTIHVHPADDQTPIYISKANLSVVLVPLFISI